MIALQACPRPFGRENSINLIIDPFELALWRLVHDMETSFCSQTCLVHDFTMEFIRSTCHGTVSVLLEYRI
jgi:hypothetical protein